MLAKKIESFSKKKVNPKFNKPDAFGKQAHLWIKQPRKNFRLKSLKCSVIQSNTSFLSASIERLPASNFIFRQISSAQNAATKLLIEL